MKKTTPTKSTKRVPPKSNKRIREPELDSRQTLFITYYFDPTSETFSNGYRSALKAGFSEEYATVLMSRMPPWIQSEKVKFNAMLEVAERNLLDALTMSEEVPAMGPFGPLVKKVPVGKKERGKKQKTKEVPIMVRSMKIVELKNKTSQFVAERLNKKRWSTRQEIGGDDGKPIQIQVAPEIAGKNAL